MAASVQVLLTIDTGTNARGPRDLELERRKRVRDGRNQHAAQLERELRNLIAGWVAARTEAEQASGAYWTAELDRNGRRDSEDKSRLALPTIPQALKAVFDSPDVQSAYQQLWSVHDQESAAFRQLQTSVENWARSKSNLQHVGRRLSRRSVSTMGGEPGAVPPSASS